MSSSNFDAILWSLSVPLPSNRQIGADRAGRVLTALATFSNGYGKAWPSEDDLADCISGLIRRDIRNALELLAAAGLITEIGRRGRARVWMLNLDVHKHHGHLPVNDSTEGGGTTSGTSPS